MSKKNKRIMIILVSGIVILSSFLIGYFIKTIIDYSNQKTAAEKVMNGFFEIYESTKKEVVLFASPYCPYCEKLKPTLNEIALQNQITYYYFDTSLISKDMKQELEEKTKISFNAIPYLIVLDNKQVIGESIGNKSKDDVIQFLTTYGIIENKEVEHE